MMIGAFSEIESLIASVALRRLLMMEAAGIEPASAAAPCERLQA
jgi:hypothetical protein